MPHRTSIINYFTTINRGRTVLWCYLIWYLTTVYLHFDPSPTLWLNSLGISAVIGVGLLLSISSGNTSNPWQTVRLFLMPFCVSSFSSLIKGHGYFLIFPQNTDELVVSLAACAVFVIFVIATKALVRSTVRI